MNKYILPIVAVLLCMAACQKEEGRILTLEVENYADDGKMHLDGDNYAVWDDGDTVHLNNVSHIVTLTGSSATISGVTESGPYYAIYPDSWASNNFSPRSFSCCSAMRLRLLTYHTAVIAIPTTSSRAITPYAMLRHIQVCFSS